jgi:hypothetical protein
MVVKKRKSCSNPNSRKKMFILSILIVLFIYGITMILITVFSFNNPYRVEDMTYDFVVKDRMGINLDSDYLHFGGGPAGIILQRSIIISSDQDSKVSVSWDGPGNLTVNKNNFPLKARLNESVLFYLAVPVDLEQGNYTGQIHFKFFKS